MKTLVTKGMICLDDDLGITYRIAAITFTEWADGNFEYVFEPCYPVIELLETNLFQGIPGLDLDQRKPQYVRRNITPVFIEERTPGPGREGLWELLQGCGMDYLNRLEWLIRTSMVYSGDGLYVRRLQPDDEEQEVTIPHGCFGRSSLAARWIVQQLAWGRTVRGNGFEIDDRNRNVVFRLLRELYGRDKAFREVRQQEGVEKAKAAGKYSGRKPIAVDVVALDSVGRQYLRGKISAQDAAKKLGISVSTFRRRMKQFFPRGEE